MIKGSLINANQAISFVTEWLKYGTNFDFHSRRKIREEDLTRWKSAMRTGARIHLSKNHLTSQNKLMIKVRKSLTSDLRLYREKLKKKNWELKQQLKLFKPEKRRIKYNASERLNIIRKVKKSKLPISTATKALNIPERTYWQWINPNHRLLLNTKFQNKVSKKSDSEIYRKNLFALLHSPPQSYDIARVSWTIKDLMAQMKKRGLCIGKTNIQEIFKKEGYRFRKARKVLTSRDAKYLQKMEMIKNALKNLRRDESFFSIDEFGPYSVKKRNGRILRLDSSNETVPQVQKAKGVVIVTAALELSTNKITFFFSQKRNSKEMIKLITILRQEYSEKARLYLSWDAAFWHMSSEVFCCVDRINATKERPEIVLAPLPARATFLNVIEAVFMGMTRAVLDNSNYPSVDLCKNAISKYLRERNSYYKKNPKKAGKVIWGKEKIVSRFDEGQNTFKKTRF
jgi:transposase